MANLRYDELNKLIKQWFNEKSQDENILRGLFAQTNLDESKLVDRSEDLKKGTQYTNLSNDDFVKMFKAETFNNLDKKELKHLFQELHNRYITEKGFDITRNVAVVNDSSVSAYGYVCANDDLMFINKHSIDKAKEIDPNEKNFNKTNLGISLLYILSHESQHIAQFESSIDNALGREQDMDTAFVAAMTTIENTNFAICESKQDYSWAWDWKRHYDYQFIEHNANYSAFTKVREMLPDSEKKGKAYDQYDAFTTLLALRDTPYTATNTEDFINGRIAKMERFTKSEIAYFMRETQDCAMKAQLMEICDKFMKVDENGNSLFRDKLRKEISEMTEVCLDARNRLMSDKTKSKGSKTKVIEEDVNELFQL